MDIEVRLATPADEEKIMELTRRAWEENGLTDINYDKVLGMIRPALYLWEGLCGIIGKPGETIEGIVLLRLGQMWYADTWILEEKFIFIDPQYRNAKGGRARRLCEFSKDVADKLNIPLLIGVLSNARTAAKVKLYERQFGQPAGAFFLYGSHTGSSEPAHVDN
jgi:hypothetical protein